MLYFVSWYLDFFKKLKKKLRTIEIYQEKNGEELRYKHSRRRNCENEMQWRLIYKTMVTLGLGTSLGSGDLSNSI